jgi:leucyl aminopeptidase
MTAALKELDADSQGTLKAVINNSAFKGKLADSLFLPGAGDEIGSLLLIGLGNAKTLDVKKAEKLATTLTNVLNARRIETAALVTDFAKGAKGAELVAMLAHAAVLSSYRFDRYHTKKTVEQKPSLKTLTLISEDAAQANVIYKQHLAESAGVFLTRDLVSEPANVLYPESFAKRIEKELKPLGIKVEILDVPAMQKLGMGSLLAVGQGSERDARLVIMRYDGAPKTSKKNKAPFSFIGKGITFDTGGISLKPGDGMWDMKWDMAGAGCVVGLMKTLAMRKAKVNVVSAVALAENMPSGKATRPGDIVTSMSGQTVEILNTDAEGRLVLADALWYVQEKYKPRGIVDLATLTGAIIIALGHEYAGAYSNNDDMVKKLKTAGEHVGEHVWHMPMCDHWNKLMDSPIADMKNISNSREAGSATAAAFLSRFIQNNTPWTHLDIAGVAWSNRERNAVPKGASGFGVRLLNQFVRSTLEG